MFVWTLALTLATLPLFGLSSYAPEGASFTCSIAWEELTRSTTSYIFIIFTLTYFMPIFVICFSYAKVILKLREVRFFHLK